jgi:hypothetical protein
MSRSAAQRVVVYTAAVLLAAALGRRLVTRGGPYFPVPRTIVDHVGPNQHETRDALIVLPRAAKVIPDGKEVTCFRPIGGQEQYDSANYLTAVGMLPRHQILPPFTAGLLTPRAQLVEYVIAIRDPFDHPAYVPIAEWPEGRVYQVRR